MQFILDRKTREGYESILSDLAREEGIIYVRAAGKVKAGQVVTTKDTDLDFQEKS